MKLPVLVGPAAGGGFVAAAGPPFNWSAEGPTAAAAVANLQRQADRHLSDGTAVAAIDIPDAEHPLLKWAGSLPDDELTQKWREAVETYRLAVDDDPTAW